MYIDGNSFQLEYRGSTQYTFMWNAAAHGSIEKDILVSNVTCDTLSFYDNCWSDCDFAFSAFESMYEPLPGKNQASTVFDTAQALRDGPSADVTDQTKCFSLPGAVACNNDGNGPLYWYNYGTN
jgi:hypothetical protein